MNEDVRRAVRSPETPARELEEGTCGARSRITASPRRDVGSVFAITPPGRKALSDDELKGFAAKYRAAVKAGPGIYRRLEDTYENLDTRGIESRIRLCRSRGFLGKTEQGRKGEIEEEERTG